MPLRNFWHLSSTTNLSYLRNIDHNQPLWFPKQDRLIIRTDSPAPTSNDWTPAVWHDIYEIQNTLRPRVHSPMSLTGLCVRVSAYVCVQREWKETKAVGRTMGFCESGAWADRGRWGQREERRITGMSGPRGMNQAEQTLNFEIRYRHTKATHRGQRGVWDVARSTPWRLQFSRPRP